MPLCHGQKQLILWISQQTAIVSSHVVNQLVFRTETECAYGALDPDL